MIGGRGNCRVLAGPWLSAALAWAAISVEAPARADDAACIAASEQSLSFRQAGKLHDALRAAATCAAEGCPAEVHDECARRVASLGAAMPTLILAAKDASGGDLYDVKVSLDGAPLVGSLDGRPIAIDPGAHTFLFEVAGQPPVERKLVLREGEKDRRETVVLGAAPAPTPPVSTPSTTSVVLTPPRPVEPPPSWGPRHWLAVAVAGAGIVGVGVGGVLGTMAISSKNREIKDCPQAGCAPSSHAQAKNDYDTAQRDATGSTIAFVAGGVLLAAGAVLWITAPRAETAAASARVGVAPALLGSGRGIGVVGEF
jgi:hypothetical protein